MNRDNTEHLQEKNCRLKFAFKFWRAATLAVTFVSLPCIVAMAGKINGLQVAAKEANKSYQERIEVETRLRDRAVSEMASMALEMAEMRQSYVEDNDVPLADEPEYRYMGEFTITAYCPCEKCCGKWADGLTASGLPAEEGIIAVDDSIIPLGSTVLIDGQEYLAADTGGAIKNNRIDIYMSDHSSALEFGKQKAEVLVKVK